MQKEQLLLVLLISCQTNGRIRSSGTFLQCSRGRCRHVGDKETEWDFDQPQPFFIEEEENGEIRQQLKESGLDIK